MQIPCSRYLWVGGQRALARPPPAMDAVLRHTWPRRSWDGSVVLGQGRASHPSPRGTSRRDGDETGRDGTGALHAVTSLLLPAYPPAGPLPH